MQKLKDSGELGREKGKEYPRLMKGMWRGQ